MGCLSHPRRQGRLLHAHVPAGSRRRWSAISRRRPHRREDGAGVMKSPGSRAAALPPPGHARPSCLYRQRGYPRNIRVAAVVLAAVALAAIVLPSGWGSSAPAQAAPPEQPDPAVAVVPAVDSAGFFVALYKGLFARHGLHVHFIPAVSSETVLGAQEAGRI